jgi:hypothetical protein
VHCAGLSCCAVLCFPTECVQRVGFRWLLFIDQLIAVMQLLHVKGLPTVHDIQCIYYVTHKFHMTCFSHPSWSAHTKTNEARYVVFFSQYLVMSCPLDIQLFRAALEFKIILIPLFEALCYKPEGRGFDSRWCHWNFSLT